MCGRLPLRASRGADLRVVWCWANVREPLALSNNFQTVLIGTSSACHIHAKGQRGHGGSRTFGTPYQLDSFRTRGAMGGAAGRGDVTSPRKQDLSSLASMYDFRPRFSHSETCSAKRKLTNFVPKNVVPSLFVNYCKTRGSFNIVAHDHIPTKTCPWDRDRRRSSARESDLEYATGGLRRTAFPRPRREERRLNTNCRERTEGQTNHIEKVELSRCAHRQPNCTHLIVSQFRQQRLPRLK